MQLATVAIADWLSDDSARRERFVRDLGLGLEDLGFVAVTDPGIDPTRLARAYELARDLFALPVEQKLACEQPESGRQRGYTPFGVEHAKNRETADLKEFWQVGRHLPDDHPMRQSGEIPQNVFPAVPGLASTFQALYSDLEQLSTHLLEAIALYLGHERDVFTRMTVDASTVLRIIHSPPLPATIADGAVRAAAHEDINLITVLPVSTAAGLELLTRSGRWVAVECPPGSVIVDTGDMMALLTEGRLPATTHRVVNPTEAAVAGASRYSMPFFVHPAHAVRLSPLGGPDVGPTAGAYFTERMRATGVRS